MYSSHYAWIRALRSELEAFEAQSTRADHDLAAALLASKRRQFELSTLVTALIETLAASNALDVDVLEGRLENLRAAEPWSAEHPEPATPDRPYQCLGCYRAIAIAEGTMTTLGMRCPACVRGRT
jgi:hypothetical protein